MGKRENERKESVVRLHLSWLKGLMGGGGESCNNKHNI